MRCSLLSSLCLVVVLLAPTMAVLSARAGRTDAECLDLGFHKDVLRCHHCEKLYMVTQSTELQQECQDCCMTDGDDAATSNAKYAAARIEVRGIFRLLDVTKVNLLALFHRTYKDEPYFENLSFHDKYSVIYPQVVLVDADGKDAVTLRIGGWSPETLHEFLTKKIQV